MYPTPLTTLLPETRTLDVATRGATLVQLHNAFMQASRVGAISRRSETTLTNYRSTFRLFQRVSSAVTPTDLTPSTLLSFQRFGEVRLGWSTSTTMTYRKNLSPFFDWCVSVGALRVNPLAGIPKVRIPDRAPEFFSVEDIAHLLRVIDEHTKSEFERLRNRAMFGTLTLAGLRRGELLGLRLTDIDMRDDVIRIRPETTKNRRARTVTIVSRLRELMKEYLVVRTKRPATTQMLWMSSRRPTGFTLDGLNHLVDRLSRLAGFRVKIHKMRHTFATRTYQVSKDIVSVQAALGHRDIKTTMVYTHALPEATRATLECNPIAQAF